MSFPRKRESRTLSPQISPIYTDFQLRTDNWRPTTAWEPQINADARRCSSCDSREGGNPGLLTTKDAKSAKGEHEDGHGWPRVECAVHTISLPFGRLSSTINSLVLARRFCRYYYRAVDGSENALVRIECRRIRLKPTSRTWARSTGTGGGVAEESYYSPLESLLNEIGKKLKPRVRCVAQLRNTGAGAPDFGLYTANQVQRGKDAKPMEGQQPERGVIECKPWDDDSFARSSGTACGT